MPNRLMYQEDHYVVLETNQPEQFLTAPELLHKLQQVVEQLPEADLPPDTHRFASPIEKAQYLIDTSCKLDIEPGKYLQWYAVRLEK